MINSVSNLSTISTISSALFRMEETISGDVYIDGGETEVMRHIALVVKDLRSTYPKIRYHLTVEMKTM